MLLALVGITGIGKTYYSDKIVERLGFEKVKTIRTREMRKGEQNGKTGLFMTKEELESLEREGKIAYKFDVFEGTYAYLKEDIFSDKDMVFEMHYTTIGDWKKVRPDIKTIYIFPKDINVTKSKITERNLSKEQEEKRLAEIEEHYNRMNNEQELRGMFDYIIYNNYDKESEDEIINLVSKLQKEEKHEVYMSKSFFDIDENFEQIIKDAMPEKDVQEINKISTGWTNIVFSVKTNDGEYFFRFPRDEFWSRTIVKDCEFSDFINGKTEFATAHLELNRDKEGRPFSVHKKIEGTALADKFEELSSEDVKKISNDIAKFMYQMHKLDYKEEKIFDINNIGLELTDFLDELLSRHVSKEDMEFWKNNSHGQTVNCIVHGDLNSSNVLINDKNEVVAFIDFGFGGYGNKYDDIGRIIGRSPEAFKNEIVKSYEQYSNAKIDEQILNNSIETWSNIDSAYINYMRKIGIYE